MPNPARAAQWDLMEAERMTVRTAFDLGQPSKLELKHRERLLVQREKVHDAEQKAVDARDETLWDEYFRQVNILEALQRRYLEGLGRPDPE